MQVPHTLIRQHLCLWGMFLTCGWHVAFAEPVAESAPSQPDAPLERIRVSVDGSHFVRGTHEQRFVIWGVNYDHDGAGRLLEDYWHDEWQTVQEDFQEIKDLGANVVRVHLQLGRFMISPTQANQKNLDKLSQLVRLAEELRLYLNLTGLGCYHKGDVPLWYNTLSEKERWNVQAAFWQAVAQTCRHSAAIFCYDLMNEPILPGKKTETEWLTGELGGKHFVQRLTLDLAGRSRHDVAAAWVDQLTTAIRQIDDQHLVTVGVIPWAHTFPGAKPLFYAPEVGKPLDFVSVHFYPRKDQIDQSLAALAVYDLGKPLVIEEIFPLHAGQAQTVEFIERSRSIADGWISFYWGTTAAQYREEKTIKGAIVSQWLEWFRTFHTDLREYRE